MAAGGNTFQIILPKSDASMVSAPTRVNEPDHGPYLHSGSNVTDAGGYAAFKALDKGSRY